MAVVPLDALKAFLSGILDYAGMLPPAKLSLEDAVRQYLHHRAEPDSWMLNRFLVPAGDLMRLGAVLRVAGITPAERVRIAVIGRPGATAEELAGIRDGELATISKFRREFFDVGFIDLFEMKIPVVVRDKPRKGPMPGPTVTVTDLAWACELERGKHWRDSLPKVITSFSQGHWRDKAVKIRCGGADPKAVPSGEDLAWAIHACVERRVPMKFTAGLHHPFSHRDRVASSDAYGFINLFTACVLAYCWDLDEQKIKVCLLDRDPTNFRLDASGLHYKTRHVSLPRVAEARKEFALGFGSCSFDEPRDDLRAIGWLAAQPEAVV